MGRLTAAPRAGAWATVLAGAMACAPPPGAAAGGIEVDEAYAAEPVTLDAGAIYLTVRNTGDAADTLDGVSAGIAGMAHLHRMAGMGGALMLPLEGAEVPAGGSLRLAPGGLHIMLMNLRRRPVAGDTIAVTLQFRRAGTVQLRVPVLSYLEVGERAAVGVQGKPK